MRHYQDCSEDKRRRRSRAQGLDQRIAKVWSDRRGASNIAARADANPYLALAAVLAATHYGLLNKLDPGAPAKGNVNKNHDSALPLAIDAALAKLAKAKILPTYLGEETLALYRETPGRAVERDDLHLARSRSPSTG